MQDGSYKHRVTVYGADWCGDTRRTLLLLEALSVDFNYVNIDEDAEGEEKVVQANNGRRRIPLVEIGEEALLRVPSDEDLERHLRGAGILHDSTRDAA
jgi:mycoredoxin